MTVKGWPRPWLPWTGSKWRHDPRWAPSLKPAPWINGDHPVDQNDWLTFPADRSNEAYYERACVVCGEPTEGTIVFGAYEGKRETAGPGGHARCLWLAVNTCPHLMSRDGTVAWAYDGPGRGHTCSAAEDDVDEPYSSGIQDIDAAARPLTRDELKALAKCDPLGVAVLTEEEA